MRSISGRVITRGGESTGDKHLFAGVELDAVSPVHVKVAVDRSLPAREWKEGEGLRNGHVHPDHPRLHIVPELTGGPAITREDGCHVAERHTVGLRDCLLECLDMGD